jgi:uncharacterized protein DUF4388
MWVAIDGVDAAPLPVCGDLSTSGICFERSVQPGPIGAVESLSIATRDRRIQVRVLAQLVRCSTAKDRKTGEVRPVVAFAFMPDSEHAIRELRAMVAHLADERGSQGAGPRGDVFASAPTEVSPSPARRLGPAVHHLEMDVSWPIAAGDKVQVVVQSLGRDGERIPFEGIVKRVSSGPSEGYRAEVELGAARARTAFSTSTATAHETITSSVDLIFSTDDIEALDPAESEQDLAGRLDRISIASLLSFFELERMTGELRLGVGERRYAIFWSNGQLIDVDANPPASVRDALREVAAATDGTFHFSRRSVDRPKRTEVSVSAMLIDLARESDEACVSA